MEPILYNSSAGGRVDFKRQEITANNLANVNTPGFKSDIYKAETVYLNSANGKSGQNTQAYTVQQPSGIDMTAGPIVYTGRDLDMAIDGDGWFAVTDSQGKEAYTRNGGFLINATGQLVTGSGKPVLGSGGPISIPPSKSVEIGSDGTISVVPLDGDAKSIAVLDKLKIVKLNKNAVTKNADGLLTLTQGSAAPADSTVKVVTGSIEGSNVNAVEQMVGMISAGREFESQMKMLSTVDDNAQKLAQVLHE